MRNVSYLNNTAFMLPKGSYSLLGLLQSRVMWFCISQVATPRNIRLGQWRYRTIPQYIERLPIPDLTSIQEGQLAEYAEQITALARQRYQLHEAFRHRLLSDLSADGKLNTKLTEWYDLDDFSAFREEVKKSFGAGNDIPVRERADWEAYQHAERARHADLTQQIVVLETQLNAVVYETFDLDAGEIALIEAATKYPYGAV